MAAAGTAGGIGRSALTVALTDDERRDLAAIERRLVADDPVMDSRLRGLRRYSSACVLTIATAGCLLIGVTLLAVGLRYDSLALVSIGSACAGGFPVLAQRWHRTRRGPR